MSRRRNKKRRRTQRHLYTLWINDHALSIYKNNGAYRLTYLEHDCVIDGDRILMGPITEMNKVLDFTLKKVTGNRIMSAVVGSWCLGFIVAKTLKNNWRWIEIKKVKNY